MTNDENDDKSYDVTRTISVDLIDDVKSLERTDDDKLLLSTFSVTSAVQSGSHELADQLMSFQSDVLRIQKYSSKFNGGSTICHYTIYEEMLMGNSLSYVLQKDKKYDAFHPYEKILFTHAVQDTLINENNPAVVVDILKRGASEQSKSFTHSVILLRSLREGMIYIIDPSNYEFSKHISELLNASGICEDKFESLCYLITQHFCHKYSQRDCNDIAVKIIDAWMYYNNNEDYKDFSARDILNCVMLESTNNLYFMILLLREGGDAVQQIFKDFGIPEIPQELLEQFTLRPVKDDTEVILCHDKQSSSFAQRHKILKIILQEIEAYCNDLDRASHDVAELATIINGAVPKEKDDNSSQEHEDDNAQTHDVHGDSNLQNDKNVASVHETCSTPEPSLGPSLPSPAVTPIRGSSDMSRSNSSPCLQKSHINKDSVCHKHGFVYQPLLQLDKNTNASFNGSKSCESMPSLGSCSVDEKYSSKKKSCPNTIFNSLAPHNDTYCADGVNNNTHNMTNVIRHADECEVSMSGGNDAEGHHD